MSHRAQHRQQSEHPKKELSHYKSENRNLKKQVARLQKELSRTVEANNALTEPQDPIDPVVTPTCKFCGAIGQMASYTTPSGKVLEPRCKACKK